MIIHQSAIRCFLRPENKHPILVRDLSISDTLVLRPTDQINAAPLPSAAGCWSSHRRLCSHMFCRLIERPVRGGACVRAAARVARSLFCRRVRVRMWKCSCIPSGTLYIFDTWYNSICMRRPIYHHRRAAANIPNSHIARTDTRTLNSSSG